MGKVHVKDAVSRVGDGRKEIVMEWIRMLGVGLLLIVSSWMDIRNKQISVVLLLVTGLFGIAGNILFSWTGWLSLAGGCGIGIALLGLSKITHGQIGLGDGGLLCVTGIYLGFYENIAVLLSALLLAGAWGTLLLVMRRAGRKTEIAFVPFVLIAYVVLCIS